MKRVLAHSRLNYCSPVLWQNPAKLQLFDIPKPHFHSSPPESRTSKESAFQCFYGMDVATYGAVME
eukprot:scaffold80580_cov83-Attheya_sp.AAC.1